MGASCDCVKNDKELEYINPGQGVYSFKKIVNIYYK